MARSLSFLTLGCLPAAEPFGRLCCALVLLRAAELLSGAGDPVAAAGRWVEQARRLAGAAVLLELAELVDGPIAAEARRALRAAIRPELPRVLGPKGELGAITRDAGGLTVDVRWDGARSPTLVLRSDLPAPPSRPQGRPRALRAAPPSGRP